MYLKSIEKSLSLKKKKKKKAMRNPIFEKLWDKSIRKKKRKIFELNTKNSKQVDVLYGEEQYKIHY